MSTPREDPMVMDQRMAAQAHAPVLDRADIVADMNGRLDTVQNQLGPVQDLEAEMRGHDERAGTHLSTLNKVDVMVAVQRDQVAKHLASGDIAAAVAAQQVLDAALTIRAGVASALEAEKAAIANFNFAASTARIAELVSDCAYIESVIASTDKQDEILAGLAARRLEGQMHIIEKARLMNEENDPARRAALLLAGERARTALAFAEREAQAARTRSTPTPPSRNPEVAALAALRQRRPVGNPLTMGVR